MTLTFKIKYLYLEMFSCGNPLELFMLYRKLH